MILVIWEKHGFDALAAGRGLGGFGDAAERERRDESFEGKEAVLPRLDGHRDVAVGDHLDGHRNVRRRIRSRSRSRPPGAVSEVRERTVEPSARRHEETNSSAR